jgi:hypothetical protein
MRNGLTKTLAAIAIACLGYQAYAVTPVVNEIPIVFVTDDTQGVTGATTFVTTPNTYVYEDFVNLNNYVSDDGPLSSLIWSYKGAGIDGDSDYRLNGAAPLADADSRIAPPAGSVVNSATNIAAVTNRGDGTAGEYNPDSNVLTPTIRNNAQSPLNAFYTSYPDTSATPVGTILNSETITLYASDGTTASVGRDVLVYTEKGGVDRLSATTAPTPVLVASQNYATATNGWVTAGLVGATTFTNPAEGMCLTVDLATDPNIGEWASPYGLIPLVANSVWRIRATLNTTQNTSGQVPLWDFLIQNYAVDGSQGALGYLGDYFFLDNVGSANAIKGPAAGLNQFDVWYTPSAIMTPQFATATTAPYDASNDMIVIFRVLDGGASSGFGGQLDSGRICLQDLNIRRFDLSALYTVGNPDVYDLQPIVSGTNGVSIVNYQAQGAPGSPGSGSTANFSGGVLTLTPADPEGWLIEATLISPGNDIDPPLGDPNSAEIVDNYPVTWQSNTLYQILVDASAPDLMGENNGPDALVVSFDTKTNELLADSYILTGMNRVGMPKVGAPQTYTTFFWSHNVTNTGNANGNRLRWKVFVLNTDIYDKPLVPGYGTSTARNLGGITISRIKTRVVHFYGQ